MVAKSGRSSRWVVCRVFLRPALTRPPVAVSRAPNRGQTGTAADTKWLNAGVMEGAEWKDDLQGTPQGAVVSPILANVYLHYVLDLWFQKKWRARKATGDTIIVRYCDDFVVGCQRKADAEQFLHDLRERMSQFAPRTASRQDTPHRVRPVRDGEPPGAGGASPGDLRLPWIHALLPEDEERRLRPGTQADCEAGHTNLETAPGATPQRGCTKTSTRRRNGWGRWSTAG